MSLLLRILLIPCLAPLMAVLLLSILHRGDPTRVRVLAWESSPLPIGAWTAMGAGGGAVIGVGIALLLRPSRLQLKRTLHQKSWTERSDDSNHQKQQPATSPPPTEATTTTSDYKQNQQPMPQSPKTPSNQQRTSMANHCHKQGHNQ